MDKETKELLKRTLDMTDDKQLLKFAKSYANKNQDFAEAIIEKFLPVENHVDYKKAVADCFLHKKRGGARRYGPSLDWVAIRKDIKRILKQLDYLNKQGDNETAASGALLLLQTLAKEFEDDYVYADYNYENSNFGDEQALNILREALIHGKYITKDRKKCIVESLKKLAKTETYRNYLPCDIDELVNEARKELLSDEELLKEIEQGINRATTETEREYYVIWKINQLRKMGKDEEANNVIDNYQDLRAIRDIIYNRYIEKQQNEEAKAFSKLVMSKMESGWHTWQPWMERLLQLGEKTSDTPAIREASQWLFLHGNISQENKEKHYHTLRESFTQDQWTEFRDNLFKQMEEGRMNTGFMLHLLEEEKLYDRIYQILLKLPLTGGWWKYGQHQHSGGERLTYFAKYAKVLTKEQCNQIETTIIDTIKKDSKYVNTRDGYAQVAEGLHLLSQTCDKGHIDARKLTLKILHDNPRKPAYREEIMKYEIYLV